MKNSDFKRVSIILVNFNGSDDTIECIKSLEQLIYPNYNIIVVDNASEPEQIMKLDSISSDGVHIIKSKENLGFSGGNNLGIKHAFKLGAQYVCLLNNDTVVDKMFLNYLVDRIELDYNIGIVCPKICEYYNKKRISYGGGEINYTKGGCFIYGINVYDEKIMNQSRPITFASGCCMLIRKEVIDKIGYLPEEYFLYYEDTDYSVRTIEFGFRIWYDSNAVIWHKESVSTGKGSPNYQYYFTRNRLMFIRKNFMVKNKLTAYPITFMYIIKSIIQKKFGFKHSFLGVKDFVLGNKGKRE